MPWVKCILTSVSALALAFWTPASPLPFQLNPVNVSVLPAFGQIAADPVISLLDGHATHNLQIAHFNALRSMSLAGLGNLADLSACGLIAFDGLDTALPASQNVGLAMFQARVVDDLIAGLNGFSALTGEDFLVTGDTPLFDADAVVAEIFRVDPSQWGSEWADVVAEAAIDAGETADPADADELAFDPSDVPNLTQSGGEYPLTSDFGIGVNTSAYSGGHLAYLGRPTPGTHAFADTGDLGGFSTGYTWPRQRRAFARAVQPASSMKFSPLSGMSIFGKPTIAPASGGVAASVPLPPGIFTASLTLAGLMVVRRVRRLPNHPQAA